MQTFGERLVAARNAVEGMTQRKLAIEVGVDKSCINNWERRNVIPTGNHVIALARILGVSADFLLGTDDAPASGAATASKRAVGGGS